MQPELNILITAAANPQHPPEMATSASSNQLTVFATVLCSMYCNDRKAEDLIKIHHCFRYI